MFYDEMKIEEASPVSGEYGTYGDYIYPEECRSPNEEYLEEQWSKANCIGDYWVSTCGRVWSAESQRFVKPKKLDKHGHLGFCASSGKQKQYPYIHRLMGKAFMPNPDNSPIVRHLDDDPSNNYICNLAWGTQKDNMRDCMSNGHFYIPSDDDRYNANKNRMVRVKAIDLKTGAVERYESLAEAARSTNVQQSNAWKVMNGERKQAGGYIFVREERIE